jgi:sarcosine oxidase subunit gamma
LPVRIGAVSLAEVDPGVVTAILVRPGQRAALDAALRVAHGVGWPEPGRSLRTSGAECLWFGRDSALLIGPEPAASLSSFAGLSEQSDAWAAVEIAGAAVEDALARVAPVDLRAAVFPEGATARTLCQHVPVSITRLGPQAFRVLAFRSMAATLVHDLTEAARAVAARAAIA